MAKKLLLADDSITIQKVVSLTFADEDIDIESVTSGDQAIEKAKSIRPNIVLADVVMPGMNGYEVCASIKADPELSKTPVVLLVGTFEPFDELEASRVQCDAYLTKPFDTSELFQLVHSLMEKASGNGNAEVPTAQQNHSVPVTEGVQVGPRPDGLVSTRSWESFLGAGSILDLFGSDSPQIAKSRAASVSAPAEVAGDQKAPEKPLIAPDAAPVTRESRSGPPLQVIPFPGHRSNASGAAQLEISEDLLDTIVERVVKRMSQEVVREVAWEVVPELSEILIRQWLEERGERKEDR